MAGINDLVVIGGGPAGLVVASVAAQVGLKVTLIEQSEKLGGDCLHTGCVPSKTLINMAAVAHAARTGASIGLLGNMPEINFSKAMDRVQEVIETIQVHDDPERFRSYGCDVRFGKARFSGPREVVVNEERLRSRRFLIATGSVPSIPPIIGLEDAGFETSDTIFTRRELPGHLLVLGGGPIGVELAQAFVRLGSRVTIIEMADRLLVNEDPAASAVLQSQLEKEGIEVRLAVRVSAARREDESRLLQLEDGRTIEGDTILVATGRRPTVHGLGLEQAGVKFEPGGVTVDKRLRTSQKHIYAAGDVCGHYAFTHMAEYHAGIVLANCVFRIPRRLDYQVIPRVVYTSPEVAAVGLSEAQAKEQGDKYHVAEFSMDQLDRAIIDNTDTGFVKLLIRKGRIIGATVVGARAGELVHEIALAMRVKAKASDITELVHAYPTYSQVHRRAINQSSAYLLKTRRVRFLAWLLQRLIP